MSDLMKILLATYWALPHLGGVWPLMSNIKDNLEAKGHDVDILGSSNTIPGYHIINKNKLIKKEQLVPLLYTPLNFKYQPELYVNQQGFDFETDLYCMELAAAYFDLEQYDIIHTQDVISARAISRVKPKTKPLFTSIHGSLPREIIQYHKFLEPKATDEEIMKTRDWKNYWAIEKLGFEICRFNSYFFQLDEE